MDENFTITGKKVSSRSIQKLQKRWLSLFCLAKFFAIRFKHNHSPGLFQLRPFRAFTYPCLIKNANFCKNKSVKILKQGIGHGVYSQKSGRCNTILIFQYPGKTFGLECISENNQIRSFHWKSCEAAERIHKTTATECLLTPSPRTRLLGFVLWLEIHTCLLLVLSFYSSVSSSTNSQYQYPLHWDRPVKFNCN